MSDEYYQKLKAEIQTEKIKNKQRTEKKEIHYIEDGPLIRSAYSRRGQGLILAVSVF